MTTPEAVAQRPRNTVARATVVVAIAWGALAFGATYPWAAWPLMVLCVTASLLAWIAGLTSIALAPSLAIASLGVAIAIQLIPMPAHLLASISPQTAEAVAKLSDTFNPSLDPHPISIVPEATARAAVYFAIFVVFLFGLQSLFTLAGTRWVLVSITILGALMAVIGLAQKALHNGFIYGFWAPGMSGNPFGPFVNKNHFAGWMLMALPLTLALLCAGISRGMRYVRPTMRDRLLWLGSRDSSRVILAGAAAFVMGIALVMTMSRSAISAFLLGVAVTIAFVLRGMHVKSRRSVAGLYLVSLVVIVLVWVGLDAIIRAFESADWSEFNGRLTGWTDTFALFHRFPITGTGLNTFSLATALYPQTDPTTRFDQSHNDYLQLLSEGGLLLAVPALIFVAVFVRDVRRRFRHDERESTAWWARAGAVTGLLSMALQETVEFSLQMPGNFALFVLLCAIALHKAPRGRSETILPPGPQLTERLATPAPQHVL